MKRPALCGPRSTARNDTARPEPGRRAVFNARSRWKSARVLATFALLTTPLITHATEFDLETATIEDINKAFDAGALTSEKLTQLYLNRIKAYDKQGPKINAVITLQPKALEIARALDKERKEKGPRSKLHGIPIVLKDLYDTKDMPTSGDFLPLKNSQPILDATVVARLRAAGAVIVDPVSTGIDLFTLLEDTRTNYYEAQFSYNLYFRRLGPHAVIHNMDELIAKGGNLVKPSIVKSYREFNSLMQAQLPRVLL